MGRIQSLLPYVSPLTQPKLLQKLIPITIASLATPQSHLPLAPPHYEDHGIPLERRDEEARIALADEEAGRGSDDEEDDEDSVDSVVPRDYAR